MADRSGPAPKSAEGPHSFLRFLLNGVSFLLCALAVYSCHPSPPEELVDARSYLPRAAFDLRYATANNFTHQAVYPAAVCLLRRSTAEKLAAVETQLEAQNLRLKIFDCYRPLSVQRRFWSLVPDERYVADPAKGSRHNRGAAVDLTLVHAADNTELDMGTGFDNFTEQAHRNYRNFPPAVLQHRAQLEAAMQVHGFIGLPTEWWHFDDTNWQRYPVSDVPLPHGEKGKRKE